jgi:hypothetical protein
VAGLACAAALLAANLWRALLFFFPGSVQVEAEAPADQMALPPELGAAARELEALGFVAVGSHEERPRLRRPTRAYAFRHRSAPAFATLSLGADGAPRLDFLTPLAPEGFVVTAAYRRAALERPRYRSGGLPGASAARVFEAHLRRLAGLAPAGDFTWEGRVAAARAWFSGMGRHELRREHLQGVVWTLAALLIGASALLFPGRA